MKNIECWFGIEPIKGYVKKNDYEIINNHLSEYIGNKYKILKKQKFILVVINAYLTTYELTNILKSKEYSKVYEIEKIANEREILINSTKYTIGIPY